MIPSGEKLVFHSRKNRLAVMTDLRSFAMHQFRRADHASAKCLSDRLVTQTHAQQRYLSREPFDYVESDSSVVRRPGSRRDDDAFRTQLILDLIERDLIVPAHLDRLTKLAEILNEVVSKRVVVVDDEKHQFFVLSALCL